MIQVVSSAIKQISALVASAVSTIGTDADVATWRNVRFIREKKACQSNIANLGVLKLSLAVGTNQNPHWHLSPQTADSFSLEAPYAGGYQERAQKSNRVLLVRADSRLDRQAHLLGRIGSPSYAPWSFTNVCGIEHFGW
jgi:hypothetical protein